MNWIKENWYNVFFRLVQVITIGFLIFLFYRIFIQDSEGRKLLPIVWFTLGVGILIGGNYIKKLK